ncbi:hypothetical protein SDC9_153898 [bioreactor metagenome]|uniref:Uncharacterized protein n=1 Tax=bioreactor metagenome TaxID=1076179 RepID=A0A645EZG0_9ZZZZ
MRNICFMMLLKGMRKWMKVVNDVNVVLNLD